MKCSALQMQSCKLFAPAAVQCPIAVHLHASVATDCKGMTFCVMLIDVPSSQKVSTGNKEQFILIPDCREGGPHCLHLLHL